jgi:hypothetical protein
MRITSFIFFALACAGIFFGGSCRALDSDVERLARKLGVAQVASYCSSGDFHSVQMLGQDWWIRSSFKIVDDEEPFVMWVDSQKSGVFFNAARTKIDLDIYSRPKKAVDGFLFGKDRFVYELPLEEGRDGRIYGWVIMTPKGYLNIMSPDGSDVLLSLSRDQLVEICR